MNMYSRIVLLGGWWFSKPLQDISSSLLLGFVFGCPEITTRSPRLGDLQLRMDANDGKLKSLSEAELWDW